MPCINNPRPAHPHQAIPEEFEPGTLPVEPDQGPVPPFIPEDPEGDRVVDPFANPLLQARHSGGLADVTE